MVTPLCEIGNKLSKGRIVSSLEWNPKAEDTILVGFTESDTFYNKTGLVQIWTLNKSSPEYTINSPSQITTSVFDPIQPKIIYCGTATGQILQYDTRTKPIPVNSTPIDISTSSLKSDKTNLFDHSSQRMPENFVIHSYLITNIGVVVEDNNSYILSFSGDGVICKWNSLDLTKPNIRKELLNTKNENATPQSQITYYPTYPTYPNYSYYTYPTYNVPTTGNNATTLPTVAEEITSKNNNNENTTKKSVEK